jgi:glucose-6-phosphate dehydrogenase assembly protein OpcA
MPETPDLHWRRPERPLDLARIEEEIDRFHHEGPFSRASLSNLIAVCTSRMDAAGVMDAAAELVLRHPARVILLDLCRPEKGEEAMTAAVSAVCFRATPDGEQVCCEVITLRSPLGASRALASAVLPLLIPDLPVYLWWSGDADFGSPLFELLQGALDGMLYDLRRLTRRKEDLLFLRRLGGAPHPGLRLGDLGWVRLQPWREMTSRLFDPASCGSERPDVREFQLRFQRDAAAREWILSDAVFYAGWIAAVLGLQPQNPLRPLEEGKYFMLLRKTESMIPVVLEGVAAGSPDEGFPPGTLIGANFRIHRGDRPEDRPSCSIRRDPKSGYLSGSYLTETLLPPAQVFPERQDSLSALLSQALAEAGGESDYERALEKVIQMIG